MVDTPSLSVCSYLVCFVEGLLQESADLVGSGALLHLLLVLTKEQLSIHILCVGGGGGEREGLDERGNMDAHRYTLMAVEGSTHLVGMKWDWKRDCLSSEMPLLLARGDHYRTHETS